MLTPSLVATRISGKMATGNLASPSAEISATVNKIASKIILAPGSNLVSQGRRMWHSCTGILTKRLIRSIWPQRSLIWFTWAADFFCKRLAKTSWLMINTSFRSIPKFNRSLFHLFCCFFDATKFFFQGSQPLLCQLHLGYIQRCVVQAALSIVTWHGGTSQLVSKPLPSRTLNPDLRRRWDGPRAGLTY